MAEQQAETSRTPPEDFSPILTPLVELTVNGHKAIRVIAATYESSWVALHASDSDPYRLRLHSNRLLTRVLPILQALEREVQGDQGWLLETAGKIAEVIVALEGQAATADEMYGLSHLNHAYIKPV